MPEKPNTYCEYVANLPLDNLHRKYHDQAYGFPIEDDNELFGRLLLEINQAGLSWDLMLRKAENFRKAYAQFVPAKVAAFNEEDRARLLSDAGIVRNRLKVEAAIFNAKRIVELQASHGSFANWLAAQEAKDLKTWMKIFKANFKFVGGEIVKEFLMSIGYLAGAHSLTCPVHQEVIAAKPSFLSNTTTEQI